MKISGKSKIKSAKIIMKNITDLRTTISQRYQNMSTGKLDLSDLDVSNVNTMNGLFENHDRLYSVDVSGWDVSNVKEMYSMFYGCNNLINIIGIEDWDVSNCDDFCEMFANCKELEKIDLSSWDVSNGSTFERMFYCCDKLTDIGNISNWNISYGATMKRMFRGSVNIMLPTLSWIDRTR